ncbi:hypothetical protein KM043_012717 [Ampulex compressa]|nr:hypothetical protein KM043_012717 [Ampulex compressa]
MLQTWRGYAKFARLRKGLRRIIRGSKCEQEMYTGKMFKAAVLLGPRNLRVECVPEKVILSHQVRIDVHYCGLTDCDALLWSGLHCRVSEPSMVLGFEVTGKILEMGRLAYEKTGYQRGEEVVAHSYPHCGGFAEVCLAHYRDVFRLSKRATLDSAAAMLDNYFTSILALGRRARLREDEYFLVNTKRSRAALAVIDLAKRVFHAKPIVVCDDPIREKFCQKIGATAILRRNEDCLPDKLFDITGRKEVRLLVETDGGSYFDDLLKCLQHEGLVAFLSCARYRSRPNFFSISNYTVFTVSAEHYKKADTLVYRETIESILDFKAKGTICSEISAVYGLNHIDKAFNYYTSAPSANVLIDLKEYDRCSVDDYRLP